MSYLVKVFDRRMYPGMGDAYSQVWRDINAWGAWCAVHVHQDAGPPGARGFTILYRHAKSFAEIMRQAFREQLLPLGVPDRGLMYRTNVSVLNNANMPAVLCECGFYTSREDELVGTEPYAQAIALGVRRFAPEGVKVAIAASLQGFPEEWDTDTEDATRIARRAGELLGGKPYFMGEGGEDVPYLEFDREGGNLGGGVYALNLPVERNATLVVDADRPQHDLPLDIYIKPIVGKIIGPKRVTIGGYGNKDDIHGGVFPLAQFGEWNGRAWVTVHAPDKIRGGVL